MVALQEIIMEIIRIAMSEAGEPVCLNLRMANRHGLITGATGTGKTVNFSADCRTIFKNRVPMFASDVKGDLSGISQPVPPSRMSHYFLGFIRSSRISVAGND